MNEFDEGEIGTTDPDEAENEEAVPEAWSSQVLKVFSHPNNRAMDIVQVEVPKGSVVKGPVEIANL